MTRNAIISTLAILGVTGCVGELQTNADPGTAPTPETSEESTATPEDEKDPPKFGGTIPDTDACEDVPVDPGPSLARRLTNWEYVNTIDQTFGVDVSTEVEEQLPDDLRAGGFTNTNDALLVSVDHAEGYAELAKTVVGRLDWNAWVDARTSCTEFEDACQREFVANAGELTFRRPLSDDEIAVYTPLYQIVADEGDDFYVGSQLVLRAMLQSPQFLYRMESQATEAAEGEATVVSDYEMASRLSYLVWNSSPDEQLIQAAAAGELQTPEQIEAQVDRMLRDPRARQASLRYVRDWLGLDALDGTVRDEERYPEFSEQKIEAMKQETLTFFETLIWDDEAPMMSMFTAEYTVVGREMAEFYGFDDPQDGQTRYDISGDDTRIGFLTHAGILTLAGKSGEPSLVERGIYVFDGILCGTIVAPPVGVTQEIGETEPGKSQRFYSEERLANDACSGCHKQFDPIGFAFERYDGVGSYLTNDEHGNELRADGTFLDPNTGDTVEFSTTRDFVQTIAQSESARDCMIQKPVQFALGRGLLESDACMLADVKSNFDPAVQSYQDLIRQIATTPAFRMVKAAEQTNDTTTVEE